MSRHVPVHPDRRRGGRRRPAALRPGTRRSRAAHGDVLRVPDCPAGGRRRTPAARRENRASPFARPGHRPRLCGHLRSDVGGRRDAAADRVAAGRRGRVAGAGLRAVASHVAGGLDTVLRAVEAPGGTSAAHRRVTARRRRSRRHSRARIGGRRRRHPLVPAVARADPRAGVLPAEGRRDTSGRPHSTRCRSAFAGGGTGCSRS